jgi:hypothetical protein
MGLSSAWLLRLREEHRLSLGWARLGHKVTDSGTNRNGILRFGQGSLLIYTLLILYIGIKSSQLQSIVEPRWVSSSTKLVVQKVIYIVKQETSNHVATHLGRASPAEMPPGV